MVFQIPAGNAFPLDKSGRPDFLAALERQKGYFQSGATLAPARRIEALKALYTAIERAETDIFEALEADLGKGEFESYMCEVGLTLSEIFYLVKHTKKFARDRRVKTPLSQFAAKSFVRRSPYGTVLVMSPGIF